MIAWTLSGGGNRAPLQVGAMRALFERGIKPAMLVGTSAGALNSTFIAADPTPETNERLVQMWLATRAEDIFPKSYSRMLLRALFGGNGLDDNVARTNNFLKNLPPEVTTFGDLRAKLYLTTSDLQTGRLFLYGDDPTAKILPAGLASTALPVVWDPEVINGHQFVDGAIVANVPISVALDRGGTEIYALDLQDPGPYAVQKGVIGIGMHAIAVQAYQQVLRDAQRAIESPGVTLHYISLGDLFGDVDLRDFSHTAEMIEQGYQRATQYLEHPTPNAMPKRTEMKGAGMLLGADVPSGAGVLPGMVVPPGAVPYKPPL